MTELKIENLLQTKMTSNVSTSNDERKKKTKRKLIDKQTNENLICIIAINDADNMIDKMIMLSIAKSRNV